MTTEKVMSPKIGLNKNIDKVFQILGFLTLFFALVSLLILVTALVYSGAGRLSYEFLTSYPSRLPENAGIFAAWVGSFLVMFTTAAISVPLGIAAGIYLEEYARKNVITNLIEINITNLAAIPSIAFALMALGLFVQIFALGKTVLTAGLTLGMLVLPIVIVATRESIRAIPQSIREAAYGLGATKWQTISHHVLPYSMGGILTGVIIALSRAIGEAAPLITIGAVAYINSLPGMNADRQFSFFSFRWLFSDFSVMPIQMYNWVSRPSPAFQVNAAAAGLVLLMMTLTLNGLAIYLRYRFRKRINW